MASMTRMADAERTNVFVSTAWLAEHLKDPNVVVIDGSWRMPGTGDARADYDRRHIPGAVFFSIDEIADQHSRLPHMLPSASQFESAVGVLGISNEQTLVVYDDQVVVSSARVWWTFRAMGHENVVVLDGGLPKWEREGRPLSAEKTDRAPVAYSAVQRDGWIAGISDVESAILTGSARILDARPPGRFAGRDPEPRPGLVRGHMPGAVNVPATSLFGADGAFLEDEPLAAVFRAAGVDLDATVITTCGSGVTAAVLNLALESLGHDQHALYDGSWAEWGDESRTRDLYPVTTEAI